MVKRAEWAESAGRAEKRVAKLHFRAEESWFAAHLFLQRMMVVVVAIHTSSTPHIMFTSARRRCVSALKNSRSAETTIPAFLVPAFHQQSSSFSTSSPCQSKIGSAPLSLPPDVNFHIIEAPLQKKGARVSRNQEGATVHIEGPLGKLSLPLPAYMNIISDEAKRTYSLSILDQEERKQREMWGE